MESHEFLAFWGWRHLPWANLPSTDQLFWQRSTLNALQKLLAHHQRTQGISLIAGPAGHGKSTLCRWLYQQFPIHSHDVVLFALASQTKTSGWLAPQLAHYLGLPPDSELEQVYKKLFDSRLRKRQLTILIDQAEKLSTWEALEDIQALLQSKSYGGSPLNFILLGQAPLLKNLALAEGFAHRLHFQAELLPFDTQEAGQFLHYFLKSLGLSPQTLSPEAHSLIIEQSSATFSGIENVLEGALIEAFLRQQRIIQVDSIQEVLWKRTAMTDIEDNTNDAAKQPKGAIRKRPNAKNLAGSAAALDLNSLYYKSDGNQDPEDS